MRECGGPLTSGDFLARRVGGLGTLGFWVLWACHLLEPDISFVVVG